MDNTRSDIRAVLKDRRLLPLVLSSSVGAMPALADVLMTAELPVAEVALRGDGALECLRALAAADADLHVGAGTATTREEVLRAVDAGAEFIVSPGLARPVIEECLTLSIPIYPGVATASEVLDAMNYGLTTFKVFPAELVGGSRWLRAVGEAFPSAEWIPTGGIGQANVAEYLELSSVLAVGGSWLTPRHLIDVRAREKILSLIKEASSSRGH